MLKNVDLQDLKAVSGVLSGKPELFKKIIEKYQKKILRLSFSFLGKWEEAEDAAQEIFIKAYQYLSSFDSKKNFSPWLYSIALNHLRTTYKRHKRRKAVEEQALEEKNLRENSGIYQNPDNRMEKDHLKEQVREAISRLPDPLKEVTILYYIEDMAVQDIADSLNIGRENVKSRLFRARTKLRKWLGKYCNQTPW